VKKITEKTPKIITCGKWQAEFKWGKSENFPG
jgi:hypothetical protein